MIENRNLSTFSYQELDNYPGLKDSIYQEVKSQVIKDIYQFADRKLGIKTEEDIKDHVYDRQQVTTQFFLALNQFNREFPDLDTLYFAEPRAIFLSLDLRLEQAAGVLKEKEQLDVFPDESFRSILEKYGASVQQRVKFIQFRNRAKEVMKNLRLDLFIINLVSLYMFDKQNASWDIRDLESFYDADYGYEVAKLISEIFLRFIQLYEIQNDAGSTLEERLMVEQEITAEIDARIFVYLPHEREELFDRIRRIIRMGYTLTELNKKIRTGTPAVKATALTDLKEIISKKDYAALIDGFLFEDIFNTAMDGLSDFTSRVGLIRQIITGYRDGLYDIRVYAQALIYFYTPSRKNNNHSYYRMLGAACLKSGDYIPYFLDFVIAFRDLLNRAWKEPEFTFPFPVLMYTWRLFEHMLRFLLTNLQELTDVTQVCEMSFNQVFIYNITRRPVSVEFSVPRKESFEKVIARKYSTRDIYIPRSSVEKYCPNLINSHFVSTDNLFMKLKDTVSYKENITLKKLVLYHREDLSLWLQRTRLDKISGSDFLKKSLSEEMAELSIFDPDLDDQLEMLEVEE
ncbi:MAG: hypothetical protein JXA95_03380 [Spirochaetales bacterium]|nr:hypothetical protein [Spirochaetales bacterium]